MDNTSYKALVDKVLQVPSLMQEIQDLIDPDTLNLATSQWEQVLKNNKTYQDLQHNAKSMYMPERVSLNKVFRCQTLYDPIHVVLIGKIYAPRKSAEFNNKDERFALVLQDSPPLNMLIKAFNSDVKTEAVAISESVRVNFNHCGRFCQYCSQACFQMKLKGLKPQPCILNVAIYDGKAVVNRFTSQTEGLFSKPCIGILKLKINSRYFFQQKDGPKDVVRIGSDGLKVIAFPESNLMQSKFCLGDLTTLGAFEEEPSNEEETSNNKRELEEEEIVELMPNPKFRKLEDETRVISEEMVEIF